MQIVLSERLQKAIESARAHAAQSSEADGPARSGNIRNNDHEIDGWTIVVKNGTSYTIPVLQGQTEQEAKYAARKQRPRCRDLIRYAADADESRAPTDMQ